MTGYKCQRVNVSKDKNYCIQIKPDQSFQSKMVKYFVTIRLCQIKCQTNSKIGQLN